MKRDAENYIDPRRAAIIAAILAAMPGTRRTISARSGVHVATISKVVGLLYAAREVHIAGWEKHPVRGPECPVYGAGPGVDAPDTRPRLTRKEISDRFEARVKGTDKGYTRRAKQRSGWWTRKAKAKPQHPFSALFVGVRLPSVNAEG